jgi:murein DD-endopeptidase MepM/ murein hydrolase activator NlpD
VNLETNRPGVMGAKPASLFKLQRDDGVTFHVVHFDKPLVKSGDSLVEGEVIAEVGNNGLSRQPHIHIGAYRGSEPLQVRFNQRFIP